MFSHTPEVLQLPTTSERDGGSCNAGEVMNMTISSSSPSPLFPTAQPSLHDINGNNGEANPQNVLLNKNPSPVDMEGKQRQSFLSNYYHHNIGSKGGLYAAEMDDMEGAGEIAKVGGGGLA